MRERERERERSLGDRQKRDDMVVNSPHLVKQERRNEKNLRDWENGPY